MDSNKTYSYGDFSVSVYADATSTGSLLLSSDHTLSLDSSGVSGTTPQNFVLYDFNTSGMSLETLSGSPSSAISWGRWTSVSLDNNATLLGGVGNFWVAGGELSSAATYVANLMSGSPTSYWYGGKVLGRVYDQSTYYPIDPADPTNEVRLKFDFGSGGSIDPDYSYIRFTANGFWDMGILNPSVLSDGTFSADLNGSAGGGGGFNGFFNGASAESIGGAFAASDGNMSIATGVFSGTRACPEGYTGTYPDCTAVANVSRDMSLSGNLSHSFTSPGYFYGIGEGNYTLVQNTLSSQSGGNLLSFYDNANNPTTPYLSRSMEWNVTLPSVEAAASYSGFSNTGSVPMVFTTPDGNTTVASGNALLYGDDMQQFFILRFDDANTTFNALPFRYLEVAGKVTPFASLPSSGVALYRSPVDASDTATVNFGNKHILDYSIPASPAGGNDFSIHVGRIGSIDGYAVVKGEGMEQISPDLSSMELSVSPGISGYLYGDQYQGMSAFSLMERNGSIYNHSAFAGYRDSLITAADPIGTLSLIGFAHAVGSDMNASIVSGNNFSFTIDRFSGVGSASILTPNMGSISFADTNGSKSGYINDDYFATLGAVDGKGYIVALDTANGVSDDYVTWGYWGYKSDSNSSVVILPSTWVAGVESNASTFISMKIGDINTTTTSYTYTGKAIGHVKEGANVYAIDEVNNNAVQLDFDFGGGAGSLKNTSYIQFKTNSATPELWRISPQGAVSAGGFSVSNTDSVTIEGTAQSGSSSTVSGKFYGPDAASVGGAFNAYTPTKGAIGVFKAVRP